MAKRNGSVQATGQQIPNAEFLQEATPLMADIAGQRVVLSPKSFSTGSVGYYGGGRLVLEVGGKPLIFQLGLNLTLIGSKG